MPAAHHSVFFTGRMPFMLPNQQCQSTEVEVNKETNKSNVHGIATVRKFGKAAVLLLLLLQLHPLNGLFSRTTWVSQYQKGKTSLDLNKARDDGVLG